MFDNFLFDIESFEEKLKRANDGDESAMMGVAMAYLDGDDVDESAEQAAFWFEKLANLDNSDAQFNIALHYLRGHGVERDFEKAVSWMKKAEENGDYDAVSWLETYGDTPQVFEMAQAGDSNSQAELAKRYVNFAKMLNQADEENDLEQCFFWAEKSAQQNNTEGMFVLALCYEKGRGTEPDIEKAVEIYEKAAAMGHAASKHNLAYHYLTGQFLDQDEDKGFALAMEAAQQGYALAYRTLGNCYQYGSGVDESLEEAVKWYEKYLEENDDYELLMKVATFKNLINGEEDNEDDDAEYEEDNDECGLPAGLIETMQVMNYASEHGFKTDKYFAGDEAAEFISEMAENGDAEAQVILAKYYLANSEDSQKIQLAKQWLKKAADNGDEEAAEYIEKTEKAEAEKLQKMQEFMALSDDEVCTVCLLEGDQVNQWLQKLTVYRCIMPLDHAKLLFEIYNRESGEYEQEKMDNNDTSYAGLDNLEEEIVAAREKMWAEMNPEYSYSRFNNDDDEDCDENDDDNQGEDVWSDDCYDDSSWYQAIKEDEDRYGVIRKYVENPYDDISSVFEKLAFDEKTYYWTDQTRVSAEEFDDDYSNHWYRVLELFPGKTLPVDLEDEDVVSVMGTGKFAAFADLSYGC